MRSAPRAFPGRPKGGPGARRKGVRRWTLDRGLRRAERLMVARAAAESVGAPALKYVNRLSDFLFVAARYVNHKAEGQGGGDVLWVPGKNR